MTASQRLDDNLCLAGDEVRCVHCGARVGTAHSWLQNARFTEKEPEIGGPLMRAAPGLFVDAPIVVRQAFCPGCFTALLTEVAAVADEQLRTKRIVRVP